MNETAKKDSIIIWQEGNEDMPVGEPALLITPYSDVITITQEGRYVNVSYSSLKELSNVLKKLKSE